MKDLEKIDKLIAIYLGLIGIALSLFLGYITKDGETMGFSIWFAAYTVPCIYIYYRDGVK